MSGPATATSYEVSVGFCSTPTTPPSPAPLAPLGTPVRRQLDFNGGGDLKNDDDDDEFLCNVVDDIERGYSEAKQRAPPCVCGRGLCAVERDDQSGQWKYVCPSRPKCKHVAFCEEVYPKSEPTTMSHPEPSNHCAFNDPTNHMSGPRTAVNVLPQVTGTATPVSVCPQVAGATTLFSDSPQGAKLLVPSTPAKFIPQGAVAATPVEFIPQGAFAATPAKVSPQGAFAATPAKVSPQGYRSNEEPVCLCTAGKCKKVRIGKEDWYVCHIPKGKGACSHKVLVSDFAKDNVPSAQATPPGGELHPESPTGMLHYNRPTVAVNTPPKSPMMMPPYYGTGTPSPSSSPNPNDVCYSCREKGHWGRDCPKKQSPRDGGCFTCGMVGHWSRDCPQRQRYGKGL